MPKETVRSSVVDEPFEVKIGWSAARDVQVGVEAVEGRSLYWQLLRAHTDLLGCGIRQIVAEANEPGTTPLGDTAIGERLLDLLDASPGLSYRGLWTTLDRGGTNDLIRVLRRARNAAFGTDE